MLLKRIERVYAYLLYDIYNMNTIITENTNESGPVLPLIIPSSSEPVSGSVGSDDMPEQEDIDVLADLVADMDISNVVSEPSLFTKLAIPNISEQFAREITGYHMINSTAVKEAGWEEINKTVASFGCEVTDEANGNHKSGVDMKFDDIGISMKSAKLENNGKMSVSSYRLTTVCSDKNVGTPDEIVANIANRDSSYQHYSILARQELPNNQIHYHWCLIPKSSPVFRTNASEFRPKMGKRGNNTGVQVGWETDNMSISFAMSSQLWFAFKFDDVKQYVVADVVVDNSAKKMSYADIYALVQKQKQ